MTAQKAPELCTTTERQSLVKKTKERTDWIWLWLVIWEGLQELDLSLTGCSKVWNGVGVILLFVLKSLLQKASLDEIAVTLTSQD